MSTNELLLPETVWNAVADVFQSADNATGRPRLRERRVLSGILFVKYTRTPWNDVPTEFGFGAGNTCRRRYMEWLQDGTWERFYGELKRIVLDDDGEQASTDAIEEWLRSLEDRRDRIASARAGMRKQIQTKAKRALYSHSISEVPRTRISRLLHEVTADL